MAEGTTTVTEKHINWGGILKGALIVGVGVVACVAVGYAAVGVAHWAMTSATVAPYVVPVVHGIGQTLAVSWHATASFVSTLSANLGITSFFTNTLGFSAVPVGVGHTAIAASTALQASTVKVATVGAGLAAGGIAAMKIAPHVMHSVTTIPTEVNVPVEYHAPVEHNLVLEPHINTGEHVAPPVSDGSEQALAATKAQAADAAHTANEMAYKAGAYTTHDHERTAGAHKNWADKFPNRQPGVKVPDANVKYDNFTDKVDADRAAGIAQPQGVVA